MKNIDTTNINKVKEYLNNGIDNSFILTNFLKKELENSNEIIVFNILKEKYYELLDANKILIEFDETTYNKYKYKPKLLSYDLYGTIDLWYLLIIINDFKSITDFNKKQIFILSPDKINTIIVKIIEMQDNKY